MEPIDLNVVHPNVFLNLGINFRVVSAYELTKAQAAYEVGTYIQEHTFTETDQGSTITVYVESVQKPSDPQ